MKKIVMFIAVLFLGVTLSACGNSATTNSKTAESSTTAVSKEAAEVKVSVVLQEAGKDFETKSFEVAKDTTVYDLMTKNFDVKDDNGFITSIAGKEQNKEKNIYWTYTINDKTINTGAKDTKLKDGDKVVFNLAGM